LIDERPEEVTDMQRSVDGEADPPTSTNRRSATQVAEMVIEKVSAWSSIEGRACPARFGDDPRAPTTP
jgi:transcription termination factor Rho